MNTLKEYVSNNIKTNAKIGIMFGSGQSRIKENINIKQVIKFSDIPGFIDTTVMGHFGEFIIGFYNNIEIFCSLGRFHYYEGLSQDQVVLPIKIFNQLGIKDIIICNSSGCLIEDWEIGDIMYINGCIDYSFSSSKKTYLQLKKLLNNNVSYIDKISKELNYSIKKGTYVWAPGPSYETPAEIKEMQSIGGAAVGMSTFPEIKYAQSLGLNIFGLALLSNFAAGIDNKFLYHADVVKNADDNIEKLEKIIFKLLTHL